MKRVLRVVLLLFVFAALPFGVLELTLEVIGEARRSTTVEAVRSRQEKALSQINLVDDSAFFASRVVKRLFHRIRKYGLAQGTRDLRQVARTMGGALEVYYFDGAGKVIPAISSEARSRSFLERCYEVIGEIERGGQPSPGRLGMLRELWKMPRVEILRNHGDGRPMPIGQDPSGGYCFFRYGREGVPNRAAGYLAFFRPERAPVEMAAACAIAAAEKRFPGLTFGMVDLARTPALILPRSLESRPEIRSALLKALSGYSTFHVDESLILSAVQRKLNGHFVAVREVTPEIPPVVVWLLRLAGAAWILLLLASNRYEQLIPDTGISRRIVGLFLFAVGLPAGLLLLGTYRALQDHSQVLQDTLERTMRAKIRQLDERFPLELRRIEGVLRKINETAVKGRGTPAFGQAFERVRQESAITEFLVVDRAGRSLWQLREPENAAVAQRYQLGRFMAREIIKRFNKDDTVDGGTLVSESISGLAGNIAQAGSWEMFQRNLGQFTAFGVGDEGSFMLFDALEDGRGGADAIACAVVFRDRAENLYFSKHREAFERQPDLTWRVSLWSRYRLGRSVYSEGAPLHLVDEIGKAVDAQLSPVRKVVETPTGKDLWIGQLGQQIKGYVFTARAPLAPIEGQVRRLWLLVASVAGILILATMALGVFLSEQLLEPIARIGEGIRAIRDRRFDHQVPVRSRDELGEVSTLMNQVMEGMQDLSVARVIQENLFPPDEVQVAGLAVYGRSRTMTDVGGDYFDYVAIDDKRLFGVVGDVSGHGVSAALIMGMAKCFFTLHQRRDLSLEEILSGFNQYMLQTIRRKKMMTLIVFRWDGATRTIQFANAGHVSPLLRRASTGTVEEISMPCMPLGVKLKASFQTCERVLQAGDALFLCTDGFPEAKNLQEQQIGYSGPQEWFGATADRSPKEVIETLFRRLEEFQGGAPMGDDVTMISLRALPVEGEPGRSS